VATGVQSPIALFAHWCLEVRGVFLWSLYQVYLQWFSG
jgi:hypothetical protein